jgi:hypothetical protein
MNVDAGGVASVSRSQPSHSVPINGHTCGAGCCDGNERKQSCSTDARFSDHAWTRAGYLTRPQIDTGPTDYCYGDFHGRAYDGGRFAERHHGAD